MAVMHSERGMKRFKHNLHFRLRDYKNKLNCLEELSYYER